MQSKSQNEPIDTGIASVASSALSEDERQAELINQAKAAQKQSAELANKYGYEEYRGKTVASDGCGKMKTILIKTL